MSSIIRKIVKCIICQNESEISSLSSDSSFGLPDLDLRPAKPARRALFAHLQQCYKCGYVNTDISELVSPNSKEIIKKESYKLEKSKFARYSTTLVDMGNFVEAADNFLKAAWDTEDSIGNGKLEKQAKDDLLETAKNYRKKALRLYLKDIEESAKSFETEAQLYMVLTDLARRAGDFKKALEFIKKGPKTKGGTGKLRKAFSFQRRLVKEEDMKCYSLNKVF